MKLLFLGGTSFIGRHMIDAALARGHEVSLFSRGKTNPGLFKDAQHLIGDRDGGLDILKGKDWDAVIDVSGLLPRLVRDSAILLKDHVAHYVFVSSAAVYNLDGVNRTLDENAPLVLANAEASEDDVAGNYGSFKVMCEKIVEYHFPNKALSLRPTFVAGPHDYTGRFTYWLERVARGGDILIPFSPTQKIQWIDAADLAAFTLDSVEQQRIGAFNISSPPLTWASWLGVCKSVTESQGNFIWMGDEAFIKAREDIIKTIPFSYMIKEPWKSACRLNADKALGVGLKSRDLESTLQDIAEWRVNCVDEALVSQPSFTYDFITPEQEVDLLTLWRQWHQ